MSEELVVYPPTLKEPVTIHSPTKCQGPYGRLEGGRGLVSLLTSIPTSVSVSSVTSRSRSVRRTREDSIAMSSGSRRREWRYKEMKNSSDSSEDNMGSVAMALYCTKVRYHVVAVDLAALSLASAVIQLKICDNNLAILIACRVVCKLDECRDRIVGLYLTMHLFLSKWVILGRRLSLVLELLQLLA